jgi:hypothetical protein
MQNKILSEIRNPNREMWRWRSSGWKGSRHVGLTFQYFTVLLGCATLSYNAWSLLKTAKYQFAIKVADVIFSSNTAAHGLGKAGAMDELFGDELPSTFTRKIRDKEFLDQYMAHFSRRDEHLDAKKEVLKLIVEHPKEEKQILDKWQRMFPWDATWLDEYRGSTH